MKRWLSLLIGLGALAAGASAGAWVMRGQIAAAMMRRAYQDAPEAPAGIAQRPGVRFLLLDHIIPPLPTTALDGPFLVRTPQIFHGPIRVGQDGDFVSLPAGATQISYTNRLRNIW